MAFHNRNVHNTPRLGLSCFSIFFYLSSLSPLYHYWPGLVGSWYRDQVGLVQQGRWSYVVWNFRMDWRSGNFERRYFCECSAVLSGSENSARGVHARAFMRRDVRLDVLRIRIRYGHGPHHVRRIRYGHWPHHRPGIRRRYSCVHTHEVGGARSSSRSRE